jgi:hypothetical protein
MESTKVRAASDIVPPPSKVNSLQALTRLRPKTGVEWSTFAFVLNRDMIKPDGTLDELHAVVFPLGSFDSEEKADEHAKNVMEITKHPAVVSAHYGTPVPLKVKFDPKVVKEVDFDMKGKIIELESAQYKREREDYEKRAKLERDVMKEAEEETDVNNIEHFKRQCYLAIKNRASFQMYRKQADSAWENYKKRELAVREHFVRHPQHEKEWLPYLKEKLTERGELELYYGMEAAYKEIRSELLGLVESDDDCHGGVCINETSPVDKVQESSENVEQLTKQVNDTESSDSDHLIEVKASDDGKVSSTDSNQSQGPRSVEDDSEDEPQREKRSNNNARRKKKRGSRR